MTHKEFVSEMARQLDWTESKVSALVNAAVESMSEKLCDEARVWVPDIGVFETQPQPEYISVNPQSGQRYLVPPAIAAIFRPSVSMKEQLKKRENNG